SGMAALTRMQRRHGRRTPPVEETESGATLLAKKEYARAVPLLKKEREVSVGSIRSAAEKR
ncbi:MAG TPA: hypothetical protein VII75_02335, partial [Thermoanaerobaculia bacterium]